MPTFLTPSSPGGGSNVPLTWNLISSQSMNTLTTISFTSISGYKYLMLSVVNQTGGGGYSLPQVKFNSRGQGYYTGAVPGISIGTSNSNLLQGCGVVVENTDSTGPKRYIQYAPYANTGAGIGGIFNDGAAITTVELSNGNAWTGGTVYLYGANA